MVLISLRRRRFNFTLDRSFSGPKLDLVLEHIGRSKRYLLFVTLDLKASEGKVFHAFTVKY